MNEKAFPIEYLMLAMINQAIVDIGNFTRRKRSSRDYISLSRKNEAERAYQSAIAWITDRSNYIFGFRSCCIHNDIDPEFVKEKIVSGSSKPKSHWVGV